MEVGSFRVTSMARTVADVACASDFAGALTVVDCGLRRGVPRAQLEGLAARLVGSRGIANFRNALGHADEKAETAGESLSRARMIEMGDIPLPRLQHEFFSPAAGSFLARSDFDWDGKVIGEFDGRGKYKLTARKPTRPGMPNANATIGCSVMALSSFAGTGRSSRTGDGSGPYFATAFEQAGSSDPAQAGFATTRRRYNACNGTQSLRLGVQAAGRGQLGVSEGAVVGSATASPEF